jgi:hypothetical protein
MITEVRNKIYSLGSAITGLGGKFYYLEAPQGGPKPYAVFSQVVNTQERDTATKFEEVYFQINHYGENVAALETIAENSRTAFEDSESGWSLTEYHLDRIEFQLSREAKNGTVFQITHQYKLELTKL